MGNSSYAQIVNDHGVKIYGTISEKEVEEVYAFVQTYPPTNEKIAYIGKLDDGAYEVDRDIYRDDNKYGCMHILQLRRKSEGWQVVDKGTILWDGPGTATPPPLGTSTPTASYETQTPSP